MKRTGMSEKPSLEQIKSLYAAYGKDLPRFEKEMKKIIRQAAKENDLFLIGAANHYLAAAHHFFGGERDTVLLYAFKAAAMLEKTDAYSLMVSTFNLLGIAYLSHENYQMALESYNRAYEVVKRHRRDSVNTMIVKNNIADCYYQMGDYKSSIPLFEAVLKAARKNPEDHKHITVFGINLASSYEKTEDYEKAMEVLAPIRPWADELEDVVWICIFYLCLGRLFYRLNDPEEGDICADRAKELIRNDVYTYEYNDDVEAIAQILMSIGQFERAKEFSDLLSNYADKSGNTIDRLVAARIQAEYFRRTGRQEEALLAYELLSRLYEERANETKGIQLTIHRKISEAEKEIRSLNRKIRVSEEKASRDPLTKLLNRSSLMKTASKFIETAFEKGEKVGGIFIDIDYFKECNDTYGHAKGDEILREVAEICRMEESRSVRFSRYGGDEFFGITHGLSDQKTEEMAKRIRDAVRKKNIPNRKNPCGKIVTLSIGLVNTGISEENNTIIDIANFADRALYHAKESGRNAICRYDCEKEETDPYRKVE